MRDAQQGRLHPRRLDHPRRHPPPHAVAPAEEASDAPPAEVGNRFRGRLTFPGLRMHPEGGHASTATLTATFQFDASATLPPSDSGPARSGSRMSGSSSTTRTVAPRPPIRKPFRRL